MKLIGTGDHGDVYLEGNFVIKCLKGDNKPDFKKEIKYQKEAADLGCAPKVYEEYKDLKIEGKQYPLAFKMDLVNSFKDSISDDMQFKIIECVLKLITKTGLIHNDLHQGNIGYIGENPVILDFGLCVKLDPIPKDTEVIKQLLASQLYALITNTDCQTNNKINLCGDQPIHNAIYSIRNGVLKIPTETPVKEPPQKKTKVQLRF